MMTSSAPVMVLVFIGLVAVIAGAIAFGSSTRGDDPRSSARTILDERYAAGEISTEEHRERHEILGGTEKRRGVSPAQHLTLIVGAAALVATLLIGLTWSASNWWTPMAGHMGWGSDEPTGSSESAIPDVETVTVKAGDLWFEPTEIRVRTGEAVNLSLRNTGRAFHDLNISKLDLDLNAQPGDTATGGLLIDTPGTYQYRCTVPGHAEAGMRGTITVTK